MILVLLIVAFFYIIFLICLSFNFFHQHFISFIFLFNFGSHSFDCSVLSFFFFILFFDQVPHYFISLVFIPDLVPIVLITIFFFLIFLWLRNVFNIFCVFCTIILIL